MVKTILMYNDDTLAVDPALVREATRSVPINSSTATHNSNPGKSEQLSQAKPSEAAKLGAYYLPVNPTENDRLDLQHNVHLITMEGDLYKAPIKSPKHVLDLATGTGIWALQFAEKHPESQVVGSDISMIQHEHKLPNVTFVKHDAETEDWAAFGHKFDYIHLRFMLTCFDDFQAVIQRAYDALNPGGYIEFFEGIMDAITVDDTLEGTGMQWWFKAGNEGGRKVGRDFCKGRNYGRWCEEVGFTDVTELKFAVPCSPWPKDERMKALGASMTANMVTLLDSGKRLLFLTDLPEEESERRLQQAKKDLGDTDIHFCIDHRAIYARKPLDA